MIDRCDIIGRYYWGRNNTINTCKPMHATQNFSPIIGCVFLNVLQTLILIFAAATATESYNNAAVPPDILREMIEEIIEEYGITGVKRSCPSSNDRLTVKKKRKMRKYDRKRAYD